MKLRHTGPGYCGIDPESRGIVECSTGDVVDVSESKAFQLTNDFPDEWETLEAVPERPRRGDKPNHTKPAGPEVVK